MTDLREAYAACQALAESHYENFPVASRLMPARLGWTHALPTISPTNPAAKPPSA